MMCDSLRLATFSAICSVVVLLNEKKKKKNRELSFALPMA